MSTLCFLILAQISFQLVDFITKPGGVLESKVGGRLVHLFLETPDQPLKVVSLKVDGRSLLQLSGPPVDRRRIRALEKLKDV
jgi:hypothetical protein